MLCPKPLRPGDRVTIVAPSGPFDVDAFRLGVRFLEGRFHVTIPGSLVGRRDGFLSGTDEERGAELQAALDDADARAIWVARGGYGASRLMAGLDWRRFASDPSWIVGFSDTTTLHLAAASQGIMSLHGPHVAGICKTPPGDLEHLLDQLAAPHLPSIWRGLELVSRAQPPPPHVGPIAGGNLTVLFAEAAAGRLRLPANCLLFLEDVNETSYRIDRMLTALIEGGHFDGVQTFLLGEFSDCSPGRYGVPTRDVLIDRLGGRGKAVVAGLPFGHGTTSGPLLLGGEGLLDLAQGVLTVRPQATIQA